MKIGNLETIAKQLEDVPGDVAEFGCFEGENTEHMARCFKGRRVWAWDTFEGMPDDGYIPEIDNSDPPGKWKPGTKPLEHFATLRTQHGMDICPVKGIFSLTIPYWELQVHYGDMEDVKFAFVHIDCDHYVAYQRVLKFIQPRMSPGGIVRLDDYGCCAGARKATDEWIKETGYTLKDKEWIYFPNLTPVTPAAQFAVMDRIGPKRKNFQDDTYQNMVRCKLRGSN